MVSRRVLSILVAAAVVLLVAVSVLSALGLLLSLGQDAAGAVAVQRIALACLVLLVVDLICLVLALALNAAGRPGGPSDLSEP